MSRRSTLGDAMISTRDRLRSTVSSLDFHAWTDKKAEQNAARQAMRELIGAYAALAVALDDQPADEATATVASLMLSLADHDPSHVVVLAEDADFRQFSETSKALFDTNKHVTHLTPEQFADDQASEKPYYSDEDAPPEIDGKTIVRAVVLYPR